MTINSSELRPCGDDELSFCYEAKKPALRTCVEPIWGWNESTQIEFNHKDWGARRPEIILRDQAAIGTMEIVRSDTELHLGEFYLLPSFQRQGIGSLLLERLTAEADENGFPIRLEVIRNNPVRSLYQRFGFKISGETETHFLMERLPRGADSL